MKKKAAGYTLTAIICTITVLSSCVRKDAAIPEETKIPEILVESIAGIEKVNGGLSPKQDYYEYVNAGFLKDIEIPADSNQWNHMYALEEEAYETLNTILLQTVDNRKQHAPGSIEQKITDLYLSAADMEKRNETGFGRVEVYLERIWSAQNIQEYMDVILSTGRELSHFSSMLILPSVDMKDSTKYSYYVFNPDLGPGKETFEDEGQKPILEKYREYLKFLMEETGRTEEEAGKRSAEILEFQQDLAASALPLGDSYDPALTYNVTSAQDFCALFSNFNMKQSLEAGDLLEAESFVVTEPEVLKKLNGYLTEDNLPFLKEYSTVCLLNDLAEFMPETIRKAKIDYYNSQYGIKESKSDEKINSEMVQEFFSFEFGRLYVETCFSQEDKMAVTAMVKQIIEEYKRMIDDSGWMGSGTKAAAKKKLDAMTIKIGYPEVWPDYWKNAEILPLEEGGSLTYNVMELLKAESDYVWNQAKKPVDKNEWFMAPQTVNAYYNPSSNEIVFPAAILQAPYYSADAEYVENLGGIGMVIAHEITHAFDDSGSQYDENGNYEVWWEEKDYEQFKEQAGTVVSHYSRYEALEGHSVNGEQTLGENIADLGALSCLTSIVGENPKELALLYTRFAQIWASKYTDESLLTRLNTDVHSPAKVRVNATLSSTDGFYLAYPEITEGDEMYVAPEKRAKMW